MTRRKVFVVTCMILFAVAVSGLAKEKELKPGPITGTWECTSHGGSNGDMQFTLSLEQTGETVTGSVTSPMGSADFSSASYKNKVLQIEIESDSGTYTLTGKLKDSQFAGEWSHGDEKGTWEGKKSAGAAK